MNRILRVIGWMALSLLIGTGIGLIIGWAVWPIEFVEADPTVLEDSYFNDYVLMIASAYSLDEDLVVARRRLNSLGIEDMDSWYLTFTVNQILDGAEDTDILVLVKLANDLGLHSPLMDPYLSTAAVGSGE